MGTIGMHGGSVVNSLQASVKPYRMWALTRDASKPNAQSLVKRSVKVVSCNICVGDEAEVRKAVEDASYAFVGALERVRSLMCPLARLLQAVTNYWKHVDKAREIAEGKLMGDAAKAADIKLFILSSKPSVTNLLKGRLDKVSHCDSKAEASDYARETGIRIVDVHVGGHMSNFVSFAKPRSAGDGSYVVAASWKPECRMPLIDTYHDAGLFVRLAIEFDEFKKDDGKIIFAYAEWVTVGDQVKILSETLGKKVHYMQMTDEQVRECLNA
jgi:hypothetical protein